MGADVSGLESKSMKKVGTGNEATREEWIKQNLAQIPKGKRILDAGAGELKYKPFCEHLEYVSQDFAKYDGKGNGLGLQTGEWSQSGLDIISDITEIPEPAGSFDAILCTEVLEHVPRPVDTLRELGRILKYKGTLLITAPFCAMTHFAPYFYQTGFSRYFYEYWLKELGFKIIEIKWNGNYFEYLAQELHRLPQIGKKYSGLGITRLERISRLVLLRFLRRLSRRDTGTEQLLAYGIHIRATKIRV